MSISEINQLVSDSNLNASFHEKGKTETPVNRKTADKIRRLSHVKEMTTEILSDCRQACIDRSTIVPSNADGKDLNVVKMKQQVITDKKAFKKAFSWKTSRRTHSRKEMKFRNVPNSKSISYNNELPQFGENWDTFILKSVKTAAENFLNTIPVYSDRSGTINIKIYRDHAQILLDRFLEKNPAFKGSRNRPIHQALMLQALATAIKVDEENGIFNSDIAENLDPKRSNSLIHDLHAMEMLFLRGIEWHTCFSEG